MKVQRKTRRGKPDPVILADLVKRIKRAAKPEKIVLFGSAARGEMGPNSDYDLLVVKGGKFNHWGLLTRIYRALPGTAAVDIVLATSEGKTKVSGTVFAWVQVPSWKKERGRSSLLKDKTGRK